MKLKKYLKNMFKKKVLTDENSGRFFEAVATVMSNQLRSIVQASAEAYHQFFVKYKDSPIIQFSSHDNRTLIGITNPIWIRNDQTFHAAQVNNNPRPVFLQKLAVHKLKDATLKIEYEISLADMDKSVSRIFDDIVSGLNDISRVENKIFSILDETKYLVINVDGEAGENIWSLKRELTGVFNKSIQQCALLLSLYDEYSYILDEDKRVSNYLKQPHSLVDYKEQISKYRSVSKQLANETASRVRTPMVMCDNTSVNEILVSKSHELAQQILLFIAGRNIDRNVSICEKFKHVSSTLLKKPMNTRELVDLVKYLTKFKKEDREELVRECAGVHEQLRFLFDLNYLVGTDVLSHVGASWAWLLRIDGIVKESEI